MFGLFVFKVFMASIVKNVFFLNLLMIEYSGTLFRIPHKVFNHSLEQLNY